MPKAIHVSAYEALRFKPKHVNVDDGRVVLSRSKKSNRKEWRAVFDVLLDADDSKVGTLEIIMRDDTQTAWVAMWRIGGKTVAKIDVERVDKQNLGALTDAAGKLNARKKVAIPAHVPHWLLLDTATGELNKDIHFSDQKKYPKGVSIQLAVPKWCRDEINIELRPSSPTFLKNDGNDHKHVDQKALFDPS
ncbi:MAG: hypothetical protein R3E76_14245 [Planctomycetota bacterium]